MTELNRTYELPDGQVCGVLYVLGVCMFDVDVMTVLLLACACCR
jgi:hypothetical protein